MECTPPELKKSFEMSEDDLLPSKSKKLYESTYETFKAWKRKHKTKLTSESTVMAYFKELTNKYKPSTLWSIYSMLKATLRVKENIDIDSYHLFKAFMKKQSSGFTSKKSSVLSSEDVEKFLAKAPDREYLATKVALIFGICGACRGNELVNVNLQDITKQGDLLVVNLPDTKTKKPRTFVITERFARVVKRYTDMRPENASTDRFFVNYQKGKCTAQVIGKNKFSKMPRDIASYLKLDDPASYTGHAFRRTSATLLADSGVNITTLKLHGGWKSTSVAEGYIEESIQNKAKTGTIISTAVNFSSAGSSHANTNTPQTIEQKTEDSNTSTVPQKRQIIETITSKITGPNDFLHSDINPLTSTGPSPNIIYNNCTFNIRSN